MKPVSVLHLIPELTLCGRDRVLLDLLSRLDAKLFSVRILTLESEASTPARRAFEAAGVRVSHHPIPLHDRTARLPRRLATRLQGLRALRALLRAERPQIVHTHGALLNADGGLAARLAGVPHLMSHDHESPGGPWRDRMLMRWAVRLPDVAFVASRAVAEERRSLLHAGSARVLHLPNGVDLRRFSPPSTALKLDVRAALGLPAHAFVIGIVGRLLPRTRAGLGIEALAALVVPVPEAYLVITGEGPERDALVARAQVLRVTERLLWLDWRDDMASVYRGLDACLSLGDGGSGRTLAEAMACGVPVVACRNALHAEIVGDDGILVEARPRAIAQALGILARSAAECARAGAAARGRAIQHLDIDIAALRLEAAYAHSVALTPRPWTSKELIPAR